MEIIFFSNYHYDAGHLEGNQGINLETCWWVWLFGFSTFTKVQCLYKSITQCITEYYVNKGLSRRVKRIRVDTERKTPHSARYMVLSRIVISFFMNSIKGKDSWEFYSFILLIINSTPFLFYLIELFISTTFSF